MGAPVGMPPEERANGLCRVCGFKEVYAPDVIWCDDCRPNSTRPKAVHGLNKRPIHPAMIIAGIIAALALFGLANGQCSAPSSYSSPNRVPASDKRAYDELRSRGYSDSEARKAAPGVRGLCEAGGGTDC